MYMFFFLWLKTDKWESFTAVDCNPSPTLELDCPLVEHSSPTAVPAAVSAAEPAAEPVAVPAALSNDDPRMRLRLRDGFFFRKGFLYLSALFNCSELLPPASSILSLLSPTADTPPPARLPAGLYRAALHTGPVAVETSYSVFPGFRYLVRRP